jgi:uncharacterized protein (DUF302 family)
VTSYLIAEPFDKALRTVRETVAKTELQVVMELDVSARIKRELNIGFGACRVLLVDSPCLLVEAASLERCAVALLPLHVVVCGRGPQTSVHWMNPVALGGVRLPAGAAAPLIRLQGLLTRAIGQVAQRCDVHQMA